MDRQRNDTDERLMGNSTSEFLRQVEGFCRFASQEYIAGSDRKALVVSCADLDVPDAPGGLVFGQGPKCLVENAIRQMKRDDGLREMLIRAAREAGEMEKDRSAEIAGLRSMIRKDYVAAGLTAFWTLCLIAFFVLGISNLITFISNLLLCIWLNVLIWHDLLPRRRKVMELESGAMQDLMAKVEGKLSQMGAVLDGLRRRMMEDDDDDEY